MPGIAPLPIAIEDVAFYMRNVTLRLPFKYGKAMLVAAPLLHVQMNVRDAAGRSAEGVSADMLPPKWFDKSADKSYAQNIEDLAHSARIARKSYLDEAAACESVFAIWHHADTAARKSAASEGLGGLVAQFGSTLMERALIDGCGKLAGRSFFAMATGQALGFNPAALLPELEGVTTRTVLGEAPLQRIAIRHTVGLADPLREADLDEAQRVSAIPVSLEGWIRSAGIAYFKIKVCGNIDADKARLGTISSVLGECCPDYKLTLDGNEQFASADAFGVWYEAMQSEDAIKRLLGHTLLIEQPIERSAALEVPLGSLYETYPGFPPVIIDESDEALDTFSRALDCGYRGTSVKNCKGVFKGLMNRLLVEKRNRETGGGFVLSGEDLCNQPILPVQQDLCVVRTLGISHVERNGHHYVGTLDHCSGQEVAGCLAHHGDLYEPYEGSARLRIGEGHIAVGSLDAPGLGVAAPTDFGTMTPLADWAFGSLGIDE